MLKISDNAKKEIKSTIIIVIAIIIFRSLVASPYKIPSESMVPTLLVGDYILTTKFDYNVKIPYTGISFKISEPSRGDVVCFDYPNDLSLTYIKRVIGIPGDRISLSGDDLYVNGKKIKVSRETFGELRRGIAFEDLGGVSHLVVRGNKNSLIEVVVPKGKFFVMGDNRPNSYDSRFWGFVSQDKLIGKARAIWFSNDSSNSYVNLRFDRMLTAIN